MGLPISQLYTFHSPLYTSPWRRIRSRLLRAKRGYEGEREEHRERRARDPRGEFRHARKPPRIRKRKVRRERHRRAEQQSRTHNHSTLSTLHFTLSMPVVYHKFIRRVAVPPAASARTAAESASASIFRIVVPPSAAKRPGYSGIMVKPLVQNIRRLQRSRLGLLP